MPSTLTYPGVYIEELPSGVHTIVGVATSIAAFIGTAPRGPVNQATTIGGFADYERTFGGLDKKSPMGFAVRDFFLNGGSQAVIVRLYHNPDTTKDSTKLPIGKLALIAANPGTWGKNLRAIVDRNVTDEAARRLGLSDASKLFNLTVLEDVPNGLIERFANLSVEKSPRRIDNVLKAQSKLAQWDGTLDPTKPPDIPGNKQPRPKDVVLGRPPRGGHFRVVAPVGGVRVGKAPLGPLVVTRSPTHLGDSPVPPVRGYTAAPVSHPAQRCSRSSPTPRNSNRSSDAHAATPDGSAQRSSLSGSRGQTPRCTSVECSDTCECGRASHALPTSQRHVDDTAPAGWSRSAASAFRRRLSGGISV